MDLKEKQIFEKYNKKPEDSWWEYGRIKLLQFYMPQIFKKRQTGNILDFGAGVAITSRKMAQLLPLQNIYACDIEYKKNYTDEHLTNLFYIKSLSKMRYDYILCMDVMEHIENDESVLQKIKEYMKEESTLLITVPAHPWLWSFHDEFLEHKRRYSKNQLYDILNKNFQIEKLHYHFSLLFPFVVIHRYLFKRNQQSSLRPANAVVNYVLKIILKLEYSRFNIFQNLFGLSLVAICTQRKNV